MEIYKTQEEYQNAQLKMLKKYNLDPKADRQKGWEKLTPNQIELSELLQQGKTTSEIMKIMKERYKSVRMGL